MRKRLYWFASVTVAAGVCAGTVWAASIANLTGQSCGDFSGTWHFVNNQTGGAGPGILNATWSSGDACTVSAAKVLATTQHFYCTASGALTSAVTNLPGRLQLSDFTCDTKEPPPCDPKTQVCK